MIPEPLADFECVVGENPLWHPDEKKVYWCDIPPGRIFRYDPRTGESEMCLEAREAVGGFTLQSDGALLLFMARGAVKVWRGGRDLETVLDEIPTERDSRFNDVIADPRGRVFCGTMATRERAGNLYRLDPDGTLTHLLDGVGCSNGLAFTPDGTGLYHTDTRKGTITLFDYDPDSGAIANPRPFLRIEHGPLAPGQFAPGPDGMTVDAEGFVWSAMWDGACLVRYAPDGSEERRIEFPVRKVSSLTFGGADLSEAYVTTAGGERKATDGARAGSLFRVVPGVRGVEEFRSRIGL